MTNKRLKLLLGLMLTFALIFCVNTIIGFVRLAGYTQYNVVGMQPSGNTLPVEDSGIISQKWMGNFTVEEVYLSKQRGPVVQLISNNKNYRLFMYKIALQPNMNFNNAVVATPEAGRETIGVDYRITGRSYFYLLYKGGQLAPASKIYITLGGDSIVSTLKNDSIISYNYLCHSLTVKYAEEEPVDIAFLPKEYSDDSKPYYTHLSVLLLKRNNAAYLMLMAPVNPEQIISPTLLNNIVTGGSE